MRAKAKGEDPLLVILDELEDPHNLGAILRSVDAVGAHGVIIRKRRAASIDRAAWPRRLPAPVSLCAGGTGSAILGQADGGE